MFPTLFVISLGSLQIPLHTYGLMIALGYLAALRVIKVLSERSHLDADANLDLSFGLLFSGLIGARLLFVITQWPTYQNNLFSVFKIWEGGLVFFGGVIGAVIYALFYFYKNPNRAWAKADTIIPALALAHVFGRVGCLAAGCCYGRPTQMPWGIRLNSELVEVSMRGIPLHPTQIYESVANLIIFFGMLWVFKRRKFEGQVILTYFMIYPMVRSIIEEFRGDIDRGYVIEGWVSTSQFISLVFFGVALVILRQRLQSLKRPVK